VRKAKDERLLVTEPCRCEYGLSDIIVTGNIVQHSRGSQCRASM
jgi:hypothetical protein